MDFSNLYACMKGRQCRNEGAFPFSEYLSHREKWQAVMESKGVDALLAYAGPLSRRYVDYLTGHYECITWGVSMCFMQKGKDPVIIASVAPRDAEYNQKALPPQVKFIAVGLGILFNGHVAQRTVDYLIENGLTDIRLGGVNLSELPIENYQAILQQFPDVLDCTEEIDRIMDAKSEFELSAMEQAKACSRYAALEYLRLAVPGAKESEIAARVEKTMLDYGIEQVSIMVSAGDDAPVLRLPSDYVIQPGDSVRIYVDCILYHYHGVYATTHAMETSNADRTAFYQGAKERWNSRKAAIKQTCVTEPCSRSKISTSSEHINSIGEDLVQPLTNANGNKAVLFSLIETHVEYGSFIASESVRLDCAFDCEKSY